MSRYDIWRPTYEVQYFIVSQICTREPAGRTRPVVSPYDTWLRQIDRHFAGMGMGRVAAWWMATRRPKEYCSEVDAATHCRGAGLEFLFST
jgi:hypothetical protein